MGFLSAFDRFGKGLKKGFEDFGVKAKRGLETAGKFIVDQGLPIVQKIASGVATAAKFAAPALAFTPFAEFAPLVAGIGAGASALGTAIGTGRKVIKVAGDVIQAAKSPSIEKAISIGQNAAPLVRGVFGT